jgi:hypothetical protein
MRKPRVFSEPRALSVGLLGAALAALLAAGCSGWNVRTDYSQNVDLARYRTYAWVAPSPGSAAAAVMHSLSGQRARAAVERTLAEKGIMPAASGQRPDFYVALRGRQRERLASTWGYADYPYWGGGYDWAGGGYISPEVYSYTEGTLVIDFIDAQTRNVIWRGTATRVLDNPDNPKVDVDSAVRKMLAEYPVPRA